MYFIKYILTNLKTPLIFIKGVFTSFICLRLAFRSFEVVRSHKDKVFEMLKSQRQICFKGGLQPDLIDDHFIEAIKGLRIKELWLACDTDARFPQFADGCAKLTKAGFDRNKIFCYVLSYGKNMRLDEERAIKVFEAGAMPFMQLYRDFSETKTEYPKSWEEFARTWQRPAIIKSMMKLKEKI
jgi:hypothetical protein